jgi:hypothetical protein
MIAVVEPRIARELQNVDRLHPPPGADGHRLLGSHERALPSPHRGLQGWRDGWTRQNLAHEGNSRRSLAFANAAAQAAD